MVGELDEAIKEVEKLLMLMRNGKVEALSFVALRSKGTLTYINHIPQEKTVAMLGAVEMLKHDILHSTDFGMPEGMEDGR